MKLLLDQNLPARLLVRLDPFFPGSTQARRIGLERASDTDLWHYARFHDYVSAEGIRVCPAPALPATLV